MSIQNFNDQLIKISSTETFLKANRKYYIYRYLTINGRPKPVKKIRLLLLIVLTMSLSACSLLEEVNNSLDYVNTATNHINNLNAFAEDAPQLMEDALTNPEALKELETQLSSLKADIEEFIALENIPAIAESIHQELVAKNEVLLAEINQVMENGELVIEQLKNSQIVTTITEVTKLLNQLENLSQ